MTPQDRTDFQPPSFPAGLEVTTSSGPEVHNPPDSHHYNGLAPPSSLYPSERKGLTARENVGQHDNGQSRPPFGLSFIAFTCVVALLTAIVVGAAVGGGLGSSLIHQRNENNALRQSIIASVPNLSTCQPQSPARTDSSATATATSAATSTATTGLVDYVVAPPNTISTVELDCPGLDGTSYRTVRDQKFDLHCGDRLSGDDVGALLAYTYSDCVESCSYMNWAWGNATFCNAVLFEAAIQTSYPDQRSNCFLKYATTISGTNQRYVLRAQLNTG